MPSQPKRSSLRVTFWIKLTVRTIILALVAWGIWRTVDSARGEFARQGFSWRQMRAEWFVLAMVFYLLGMLPSCLFWWRALHAMGQRPTLWQTLRAFYIGHLGKYVPGKALVVVLRTGLIRGAQVDTTVAAASVFVETLTMMAVGAVIAALILGFVFRTDPWFVMLATFLAVCAGVPTYPPLFRRALRILQVHRANPDIDKAIDGLNARLMGFAWLAISFGWLFFGLSMLATMKAMGTELANPSVNDLPLLTAAVALAMVAGFLSLLPGGIGVRELVVIPLLKPHFGEVAAIIAAVLLRVTWMLAELLLAAFLYFAVAGQKPEDSETTDTAPP